MTKEEYEKLSEDLKMDILKEIAYEYAVFVPKDEKNAISKFKSFVKFNDKKFLERNILENEAGGQLFPYNIIMGKVDNAIESYYQEFKLDINAQELLSNYGHRGEKFNTYFTDCLKKSQNSTADAVKQELFRQLIRGNDAKSAINGIEKVIEYRTNSLNKLLESLLWQMEQSMVLWDYQDEGFTKYRINAMGENCRECQSLNGTIFNIAESIIGENLPPIHPNCDCAIEILDEQENVVYTTAKAQQEDYNRWQYLQSSLKQLILGNYTDDVNLVGTLLQVLTGLLGVDLPLDIRDLFYDVTNFKLTGQHITQTLLDTAALLPIVGGIKYSDEAGAVLKSGVKHGDEIIKTTKSTNKTTHFADFPKEIHLGRQGKHIVGHNNYKQGRSILTISLDSAEKLVKKHSGTGSKINNTSERINFKTIIGKYVDKETGKAYDTTIGTIRYSKDGVHIVPARPGKWEE